MARKFQDYVTGLLTGKFVTVKDMHGKMHKEFKPFKLNKHTTLQNLRNVVGETVTEDLLQVTEGLRHRPMHIDYGIFSKSKEEKSFLKRVKKAHKSTVVNAGFNPSKRLNISQPHVLRG